MSLSASIGRTARRHGASSLGPRQALGQRHTIPAPTRGWNTRDGYANMKPDYAILLDNYFPEAGAVRLRKGSAEHASGVGTGYVESLIAHSSGTVDRLYAAGGGSIYDATAAAAVGTALVTGQTGNRWQAATMVGRTILVNGEDAPQRIEADGTFATAHGWTGPTSVSSLFRVIPFKGYLIFLQKDSASAWATTTPGAVQGALTEVPFDRYTPESGNVRDIGTITVDAGLGVDDLLCIFFESGAVAVFQGTIPAGAVANVSLVGIWNIGRLVGDRPLVRFGGDLVAVTTDGYVPMTRMLTGGRLAAAARGRGGVIGDEIASEVSRLALVHGTDSGWGAVLHTPNNWLLFNIPSGGGVQHVMNTQTGAWCQFTGWDARCFTRFNDKLYFGGAGGKVYEAGTGSSDGGEAIEGDVQSAFNYMGSAADKRFTLARVLVEADASVSLTIGTTTDFGIAGQLGTESAIVASGASWNDADWDTSDWAGGIVSLQEWQAIGRDGTALSVRLRSSTTGANMAYYAADVVGEVTQGIL